MRILHSPSPLASLLILLTSPLRITADSNEWPYNLPANVKYYPEHERLARRNIDAHARLRENHAPTAVRKMSSDEGEMFFLDYWQFGPSTKEQWDGVTAESSDPRSEGFSANLRPEMQGQDPSNLTDSALRQPFLLHSNTSQHSSRWSLWGRSLSQRDFQCPSGTESCASIGRPDSCCGTGETCVRVTDTGLGDVGCCARGSFCGSGLSPCNTAAGYQSCPGSPNGGCCIPNFACLDIGCTWTAPYQKTSTNQRQASLPQP